MEDAERIEFLRRLPCLTAKQKSLAAEIDEIIMNNGSMKPHMHDDSFDGYIEIIIMNNGSMKPHMHDYSFDGYIEIKEYDGEIEDDEPEEQPKETQKHAVLPSRYPTIMPTYEIQHGMLALVSPKAITVWLYLCNCVFRSPSRRPINSYLYQRYYNKNQLAASQSIRTICDNTGLSDRTVQRAIQELMDAGFIVKHTLPKQYQNQSARKPQNIYLLGFKSEGLGREVWLAEKLIQKGRDAGD
jgi:hypothetical protein